MNIIIFYKSVKTRSLELDLKRGVEIYTIKEGLVDLDLRIEVLQDEGLSIENLSQSVN